MARLTSERLEMIIGRILQVGVITAAVIVAVGGIVYLAGTAATIPDYHTFHRETAYAMSLPSIIASALAFNSYDIILLGLLLLIATPIVRVIFSVIAFILQRDATYVVITLIVLSVLLYSLIGHGLKV